MERPAKEIQKKSTLRFPLPSDLFWESHPPCPQSSKKSNSAQSQLGEYSRYDYSRILDGRIWKGYVSHSCFGNGCTFPFQVHSFGPFTDMLHINHLNGLVAKSTWTILNSYHKSGATWTPLNTHLQQLVCFIQSPNMLVQFSLGIFKSVGISFFEFSFQSSHVPLKLHVRPSESSGIFMLWGIRPIKLSGRKPHVLRLLPTSIYRTTGPACHGSAGVPSSTTSWCWCWCQLTLPTSTHSPYKRVIKCCCPNLQYWVSQKMDSQD